MPKPNGFGASFVLAPNENDELDTVAADALLLLLAFPKGETLGGAELNAVTLVAFALGAVLNENDDLVSVAAAAAVAGAPKGDAVFGAKLNADEELPNAGGAVVLLFVPALNPNGVFVSFDSEANVEPLAAGFAVWPNVNAEFVFVDVFPNMPPLDAVVVGVAVCPKPPNTPLLVAGCADGVAVAPNNGVAVKLDVAVALLLPNRLAPSVLVGCDELPNTGLAQMGILPNDFCGAPNRFVVDVWPAVVTTGAPNELVVPNAGVALEFAPKAPKTGVAAELLKVVVDAPNAGGAVVVIVALLRLNDPPKLGIVVVAMLLNDVLDEPKLGIDAVVGDGAVGVPKRFVATA